LLLVIPVLLFLACKTPPPDPVPDGTEGPAAELRSLIELGSPVSLARAAALLGDRELAASEQGRALNAAAAALQKFIYPDVVNPFSSSEAPTTYSYYRIIRDAARGVYTQPASGSRDFLEYTLPFLAYYGTDAAPAALRSALSTLDRAAQLNSRSVLPPLFRGFVLERAGEAATAETAYRRALELAGDCYPAELGLARVLHTQGKSDEELGHLSALASRYPANIEIKKQQARLYAERREWSRTDSLIGEILRQNGRDGEFLLLRSRILLNQGLFRQAQAPLDTYASIDSSNRDYLFLRARVQAEGYRNRDAALNYLRPLVRADPNDAEKAIYMASLLLESPRAEDNTEARAILNRLLGASQATAEMLALAVEDGIRREDWRGVKPYLDRLLAQRKNSRDLLNAYQIERGLGNHAAALSHARELYNQDNSNDEAVMAYISALIDTGRQSEASRIIDQRLIAVPGGVQKSRYYYLRSRLRNNEDAVMNDLRSALFEDPRNLEALIAMFEIYHRRKDDRRAVYYLKQALSIAPDNPQIKRYEEQYRPLL
jgi:thioredoxin-like negative regulator of GroEL